MLINIANYRLFSPQELRSYAEKGLISFDESHYVYAEIKRAIGILEDLV